MDNTEQESQQRKESSFFDTSEGTIKTVFSFAIEYFRTIGLMLIKPHRTINILLTERQQKVPKYIPPLTFLTISCFLVLILIQYFGISIFALGAPQELFRIIGERLTGDISIIHLLISSLPLICFVVIASHLAGKLTMSSDRTRRGIAGLIQYVVGFQGAIIFLVIILYCSIGITFKIFKPDAFPIDPGENPSWLLRAILWFIDPLLINAFFWYPIFVFPLIAISFGVFVLEPIRSRPIKALKILTVSTICILVTMGMSFFSSTSLRFNTIMHPELTPIVHVINDGDLKAWTSGSEAKARFDKSEVELLINVTINNPTKEKLLFLRDSFDLYWRTDALNPEPEHTDGVHMRAVAWSDGDSPALVVGENEIKWIKLSAKFDCSEYNKLKPLSSAQENKGTQEYFKLNLNYVPQEIEDVTIGSANVIESKWFALSFSEITTNSCTQ